MSASPLDARETYARLDAEGLYGRIAALPEQIDAAWRAASALALPESYRATDRVLVLGMGGSGIGGAILQALAAELPGAAPAAVARGYALPAWAGERTLVLASSNSGDTEEVVEATRAALAAGARCVAITTGGRLGALAREHAVPALTFAWDGEPRAALGWSTVALLAICGRLGLLPDLAPELPGALAAMRDLVAACGRDRPEADNPAKQIARRLSGTLPVFVGAQALAPVAYRWRTQFNENAKSWAVAEELPELDHNAPLGFGAPAALLPLLRVVFLQHASMHPRVALRVDATRRLLADAGVAAEMVAVPGATLLAQVLWAVQLGDLVSYYAGLLHGVHPARMETLAALKRYLAGR